ncbi:hypothetical protein Vretifemale_117 [Volvox reticuliferus]|uniref:CN hydrolase domain-containing protein n=1 Tax=Volvox reticuliferus TaxID=1737510 RepID=A0A8J4FFT1_9CHLO|nr:hypothetical protein Vretifemale_117 [Volvox reticuliferus]
MDQGECGGGCRCRRQSLGHRSHAERLPAHLQLRGIGDSPTPPAGTPKAPVCLLSPAGSQPKRRAGGAAASAWQQHSPHSLHTTTTTTGTHTLCVMRSGAQAYIAVTARAGDRYQEKFYFNPGDTGFRVFDTKYGKVGIAICWDQWFPEAARALALQGAEVILYPTAIGSEPQDANANSYPHWIRAQLGHAAANLVPVVVSNRIGTEQLPGGSPTAYYGGSFIAGPQGQVLAQVGASELLHGNPDPHPRAVEGFVIASLDLDQVALERAGWGIFRDRRPELYGTLATLAGAKP